ncbi:MAG: YaiI/YqxD family protein [Halioglobus sp.]|nr:YaiI/YqxD family protein [Halioglobus sp.]
MSDSATVWVDADACPRVIRDILVRAAQRVEVPVVFVANHALGIPQSTWARSVQVEKGFDVADNYIVQQVAENDLVVTSDIPLAAEVIELGAQVITSRGEKYTRNNVRQRLNMRDFMETMRSSAVEVGGGPPALNARDTQEFANALDAYLAKYAR